MPTQPGNRVIAISHGDNERRKLFIFGHGVYEGPAIPTPENGPAGWMGEAMIEQGLATPMIRLDNGKVVWGCECWFGPEDVITKKYEGFDFLEVDIDEVRKSE